MCTNNSGNQSIIFCAKEQWQNDCACVCRSKGVTKIRYAEHQMTPHKWEKQNQQKKCPFQKNQFFQIQYLIEKKRRRWVAYKTVRTLKCSKTLHRIYHTENKFNPPRLPNNQKNVRQPINFLQGISHPGCPQKNGEKYWGNLTEVRKLPKKNLVQRRIFERWLFEGWFRSCRDIWQNVCVFVIEVETLQSPVGVTCCFSCLNVAKCALFETLAVNGMEMFQTKKLKARTRQPKSCAGGGIKKIQWCKNTFKM